MASRRGTTGRNRGSGWGRTLAAVFLLVVLAAAGAAAFVVMTPFGPSQETLIEIRPGSSTVRIGRQLQEAGIVRSQYVFDAMRWVRPGTLKAGDYRFDHPAPVSEVYDRMRSGDTYTIEVTIPEGANIFSRKVARSGHISYEGRPYFISKALAGRYIRLVVLADRMIVDAAIPLHKEYPLV